MTARGNTAVTRRRPFCRLIDSLFLLSHIEGFKL